MVGRERKRRGGKGGLRRQAYLPTLVNLIIHRTGPPNHGETSQHPAPCPPSLQRVSSIMARKIRQEGMPYLLSRLPWLLPEEEPNSLAFPKCKTDPLPEWVAGGAGACEGGSGGSVGSSCPPPLLGPLPDGVLMRLGERERGKSCLRWFLCIGTTF